MLENTCWLLFMSRLLLLIEISAPVYKWIDASNEISPLWMRLFQLCYGKTRMLYVNTNL